MPANERRHSNGAGPAPISVTMIGALPPWRGVAPYTRHLLHAFEELEGVDVEFIDFSSLYPPRLYPGGDPLDRNGRRSTFRRTRVRRLLAWYNPLSWIWAGLTLRGRVVHAQWWSPVLAPVYAVVLGLARLRGRRVIVTLHNAEPHETGAWQRRLLRSVYRFADHFIVHSRREEERLAGAGRRADAGISTVPHGTLTVGTAASVDRGEARRELGLPPAGPVVLAFGNIRPYKGIDVLLRAARLLLDRGEDATLAIAGQPWGSFEPYERLIEELGLETKVRTWLGFASEERVARLFAAADLVVLPYTHFNAQSGAGALALSFGLPLLVTDVGGLPELVADARAVVPPQDAAALADAMHDILSDEALRKKLAADSRGRAAELGWAAIAAKTFEIYAMVASRDRTER